MVKRLIKKCICILLSFTFLNVTAFIGIYAEQTDEFDMLRERWNEYLTGGTNFPQTGDIYDKYIAPKISSVGNNGLKWYESMANPSDFEKNGWIWSDLQMGDTMDEYNRDARKMSSTFERIEAMAKAYKVQGSVLEGDKKLKDNIILALEYMYKYKYNENTPRTNRNLSPSNPKENWYEWEIRAPKSIVNTLTLIYDDIDKTLIDNLLKGIDRQVPSIGAAATGSNRLNNCLMEIVGGIVQKNEKRMNLGISSIDTELKYSVKDDGFYEDGSFIQHHQYPYNGAYGTSALASLTEIVFLFENSSFMPDNPDYAHLYDWVYNSFDSLCYEGRMMDSTRGRSIARSSDTGYGLLESLVLLSQFAPNEYSYYYKSLIKRWSENNTLINPYSSMNSVYTIIKLYDILKDETISSAPDKNFYKNFGAMDRAVMFRDNFAVNISMYSDRILNYESINGENLQGWHTASGAMYLYNDDLDHYNDGYWATVDRHRIPGTTVVKNSTAKNGISGNAFAGGVEMDGYYGVNAMKYNAPDDADGKKKHDLSVQKAWFVLDDEIVCLGSGITSSVAEDDTETILENRKVDYLTQDLVIDGEKTPTGDGWTQTKTGVSYAYLRGNSKSTANPKRTDIGYYFPNGGTLSAKREVKEDSYSSIGTGSTDKISRKYISLALEHGKQPKDETYAYALIPGKTLQEVEEYAQNPGFEIISNTSSIQSVQKKDSNLIGAAVWEGVQKVGDFTVYNPSVLMVDENEDVIKLSISDVTQTDSILRLTLDDPVSGIKSMDYGVSIYKNGDKTEIIINTAFALGKTFHIEFSKQSLSGNPSAPQAPFVQVISATSAQISWEAEDSIKYYPVYSSEENGEYMPVTNYDGTEGKYIHRNLTPGKTYYYRIYASNDNGVSEYSLPTEVTLPDIPDNMTAERVYDDFNSYMEGPIGYQDCWSTVLSRGSFADISALENGGKKLNIYAEAAVDTDLIKAKVQKEFQPLSGIIAAEGDFEIHDDSWKNLFLLYDGDTIAVQVFANGGKIWAYNGSTWNTKHEFKDSYVGPDETYHITVTVDTDKDEFAVYLNGRELEYSVDEPLTFRNKAAKINKFECGMDATTGSMSVDNIHIHKEITFLKADLIPLDSGNGRYIVSAAYLNPSQDDINSVFFAALKNKGRVISLSNKGKVSETDNTKAVFTAEIEILQDSLDDAAIECFLWKNIEGQQPVLPKGKRTSL